MHQSVFAQFILLQRGEIINLFLGGNVLFYYSNSGNVCFTLFYCMVKDRSNIFEADHSRVVFSDESLSMDAAMSNWYNCEKLSGQGVQF